MRASGSAERAPARTRHAVKSFPPLAGPAPRLLILGSMPGRASLAAGCYYAHPRNAFWPIMGELFAAGPDLPYPERATRLAEAGVAVWDVLARCVRAGSLDAAIRPDSLEINDIAGFLATHPGCRHVALNGGTAAKLFWRHVWPSLPESRQGSLRVSPLPSTSPANAGCPPERKAMIWRDALTAP